MTYNTIFQNNNILSNIPLAYEGRKLPKSTAASVMLLRVKYQQKCDEFIKTLQNVQNGLKKEGYEQRAQEVAQMKDVFSRKEKAKQWKAEYGGEKPEMPSDEEIEKAEKTKSEILEAFEAEKKEIEEATHEAQEKESVKEVVFKDGKLSKEELADIYEMIGVEGQFNYTMPGTTEGVKVSKEWFLNMIAFNLV